MKRAVMIVAKCKTCHRKGFVVETDVNGLCSDCAPYFYTQMQDDLRDLEQAVAALHRIDHPAAAAGRLETAELALDRLRPYAKAGLVNLPMPLSELDAWLEAKAEQWQEE